MTETDLAAYFEDVATTSIDIRHEQTDTGRAFYRMADPNDLDEFDQAVRSMAKDHCLILEMGSGNLASWDSQEETDRLGLHVLCKSTDGKADINTARDTAKMILLKIVSKMRHDCKIAADRAENVIGPLKALGISFDTKVKFDNMTAIDGNWYGKSFYFDFKAPINLVYDPQNFSA